MPANDNDRWPFLAALAVSSLVGIGLWIAIGVGIWLAVG